MPSPLSIIKSNVPYAYIVMGVAWLLVAFLESDALLLWPVVACLLGGVLLRLRPGQRFTWAWATAAAMLGLALAVYQAYMAAPLVSGTFYMIAGTSLVVFGVFAVAHVFLVYLGNTGTSQKAR